MPPCGQLCTVSISLLSSVVPLHFFPPLPLLCDTTNKQKDSWYSHEDIIWDYSILRLNRKLKKVLQPKQKALQHQCDQSLCFQTSLSGSPNQLKTSSDVKVLICLLITDIPSVPSLWQEGNDSGSAARWHSSSNIIAPGFKRTQEHAGQAMQKWSVSQAKNMFAGVHLRKPATLGHV